MIKTAIVQQPSAYFDIEASIEMAVKLVNDVASKGAQLIMFPEAWFPGYPEFAWRCNPYADDPAFKAFYTRLTQNTVDLSKDGLKPVRDAAKENGVVVIAGIQERESGVGSGTIFNTACTIDADGAILNVHRKLMPTDPERRVWGFGDARGLRVVESAIGRIGALLCWENYMPLSRYALYGQNMEVLLAPTADISDLWIKSMQHIAFEGGCWVVASATAIQANDVPEDIPYRDELYPDPEEWLLNGNAVVCAPDGSIAAGPSREEKNYLWADMDLSQSVAVRRKFDATGHYSRPDVFTLNVDRSERSPVSMN